MSTARALSQLVVLVIGLLATNIFVGAVSIQSTHAHTRSNSHSHSHSHTGSLAPDSSEWEPHAWIDMPSSQGNAHYMSSTPDMRFETSLSYSEGCLDLPFALCVGDKQSGGSTVIPADAVEKGNVGHWSFDDAAAQDYSGNMNAMSPPPEVGPGFLTGSSAYFNGTQLHTIPHIAPYSSPRITITFWIFIIDDSFGTFRPIFHKGTDTKASPSIKLIPDDRRLHITYTTLSQQESFESRSVIPLRQWTHVAYVQDGRLLSLLINGVLDVERTVKHPGVVGNTDPIYVGRDPWHPGLKCYLDDLKIYNRALDHETIRAVGSVAFPDTGSHFARLGCKNCYLPKAKASCGQGYHLCSKQELGRAMNIASSMGWVSLNSKFWDSDSTMRESLDSSTGGVGLCCSDD